MLRCPVGAPFNQRLAENTSPAGRRSSWTTHRSRRAGVPPRTARGQRRCPPCCDRVCALHSRRLDRCRPLWEMHVFDGLADGAHRTLLQDAPRPDRRHRLHPRRAERRVAHGGDPPAAGDLARPAARRRTRAHNQSAMPAACCRRAWPRAARQATWLDWSGTSVVATSASAGGWPLRSSRRPTCSRRRRRPTASWLTARCRWRGCVPLPVAPMPRSTTCCWQRSTSR